MGKARQGEGDIKNKQKRKGIKRAELFFFSSDFITLSKGGGGIYLVLLSKMMVIYNSP